MLLPAAAPAAPAARRSRRRAARSRRRAGSRSCRGRCRRTRPRGRRGRCRPCPCRCCRRSSGCRGARSRARRRGSPRRTGRLACARPRPPRLAARRSGGLQQRDAGLPAVDADQHLLLHEWILSHQKVRHAALVGSRSAALRVDRLQQADGQEGGEHRGAAVAEQRQRDAGDGHDPDVHADVDEDLEQQHRDDAAGDQRAVEVLGHGRGCAARARSAARRATGRARRRRSPSARRRRRTTKSVWCSGRKLQLRLRRPSPRPVFWPAPIAIRDWFCW